VPHLFLASALFLGLPPSAEQIDRVIETALAQWQVPGIAVVIVHEGRVVHRKGYGVAELGTKTPVTPDTVFPLASCTKPFTTTLLATLVDDGRFGWNDPVRKHLPFFRLKDPVANERVNVRDLLCHRTGLGPHDLLWYRSPWSIEDRVRKLALLDPVADFRTGFHYQTIAFGAAGLAGERAAGRPWADLLLERVLRPLGMTSSAAVQPTDKAALASPHKRDKAGVIQVIPRYDLASPDPAGSLHSTARDLASFLQLHLDGGVHDGKRLVSSARIRELQEPNVVIPFQEHSAVLNPETVQISYGLGWIIQDYRGRKMILHGGAIDGFRSHLAILPQAKLGIGILSNLDGSLCNYALAHSLVDLFLGVSNRAWNDIAQNLERHERQIETNRAALLRKIRPLGARPPRPLADYLGFYEDDAYGPCHIALKDRGLELTWGLIRSPLEHYQGDVFLAAEPPFHDTRIEFALTPGGGVAAVKFLERTFARRPVK
jgi:CubicO group peptidase (beta-lactamase class C family)